MLIKFTNALRVLIKTTVSPCELFLFRSYFEAILAVVGFARCPTTKEGNISAVRQVEDVIVHADHSKMNIVFWNITRGYAMAR